MIGVGDKVVCVREIKDRAPETYAAIPAVGEVYTVRDICESSTATVVVYLEEIVSTPVRTTDGMMERGFQIKHFRKVTAPKQFKTIERFVDDLNKSFGREMVP